MIDAITSKGWIIDFTDNNRAPAGFIEFRKEGYLPFWRLTIREGYEYLGGQ